MFEAAYTTENQKKFAKLVEEGKISYSGNIPRYKPEESNLNAPLTDEELQRNKFHNERLDEFFINKIKEAEQVNYPTEIQNDFARLVQEGKIQHSGPIPMFKDERSTPSKQLTPREIEANRFHNEKLTEYLEKAISNATNKNNPFL